MSGIQQMLAAVGGGIVLSPQNGNMLADSTVGDSTVSTLAYGADGSIGWSATPVDGGSSAGDSAWYEPITSGIGALYYIRFTATSGTLTTNSASTFTSLASPQSCSKSGTTSTSTATVTVEIATDIGGTNIVYTMTGSILRYQHTL